MIIKTHFRLYVLCEKLTLTKTSLKEPLNLAAEINLLR
jgi:hypothetical protein